MSGDFFKFKIKVFENDKVTNIFDLKGDKKKIKQELEEYLDKKC